MRDKVDIVKSTMLWLEQYGWITTKNDKNPLNYQGVQLTEKALYALNWLPETLQDGRTLGQRIGEAVAAQSAASAVGSLVGEAIRAFFKS